MFVTTSCSAPSSPSSIFVPLLLLLSSSHKLRRGTNNSSPDTISTSVLGAYRHLHHQQDAFTAA
eukprot:2071218-Rhodomonas_salina.1